MIQQMDRFPAAGGCRSDRKVTQYRAKRVEMVERRWGALPKSLRRP